MLMLKKANLLASLLSVLPGSGLATMPMPSLEPKPKKTSKYTPHQGKRECLRRRMGGFAGTNGKY